MNSRFRASRICVAVVVMTAMVIATVPGAAAASNPWPSASLSVSGPHAQAAKKKCKKKNKKKCKKKKPVAPSSPVTVPGGSTPPGAPGGPPLAPAPKVDIVTSDQVLQLPGPSDSTLIISGGHQYTPGQYLSAAPGAGAPDGFLVKVISSTIVGGETQVEVEAASLYDAVPNGQIDVDLGDLGSASSATPANADARRLSAAIRAGASGASENVPFSEHVSCDGSAAMDLSGSLTTSLDPNFDLKWHTFAHVPTGIDTARATVDASVSADASASVSGAASCDVAEITLLEPRWTVLVQVGPVPVPLTIDVPINVSASASVNGSVSVEANASVVGLIGVEYHDGDIDGIHQLSTDAGLSHSVDANASAGVKIGPDVSVQAGWDVPVIGELAATVGVGVSSGLDLSYDIIKNPPGKLCVPLTIDGSVSLDVPVAGHLGAGPKTLFDTDIKCVGFGGEDQWRGTVTMSFVFVQPFPTSHTQEASTTVQLEGETVFGQTPSSYTTFYRERYYNCTGGEESQGFDSTVPADGTTATVATIQANGTLRLGFIGTSQYTQTYFVNECTGDPQTGSFMTTPALPEQCVLELPASAENYWQGTYMDPDCQFSDPQTQSEAHWTATYDLQRIPAS